MKRLSTSFLIVALLLLFVPTGNVLAKTKKVSGQVLVAFKPTSTLSERNTAVRSARARTIKTFNIRDLRLRVLKVNKGQEEEVISDLDNNPNVLAADYNTIGKAAWVPNDPYYIQGSNGLQWNLYKINMANAWDVNKGSDTIVAVVDSGVATSLTDLTYANVLQGYDYVNNDSSPADDNGHGSHVTGTIASATNNSIGTAGIAPEVTILPVKVLDSSGLGSLGDILEGAIYAYQNADIINLSITLTSANAVAKAVFDAISQDGIPIIAAAGNDGASSVSYPAAYDSLISVAATNFSNSLASYSNYGTGIDISAPGGQLSQDLNNDGTPEIMDLNGDGYADGILQQTIAVGNVAGPGGGFELYQGTSMATPHVTGVAALLFAQGVRGPEHIRQAMISTATDLGTAGYDTTFGYGLLNATTAFNLTKSSLTIAVSQTKANYAQSVRVSGSLSPAQVVPIKIQTYDDSKNGWSTVKTVNSASDGSYAANIKLARNSYIRADWDGTASVLGQMSIFKRVKVKTAISAKASAKRIKAGASFILSGKVSPSHSKKLVAIQERVGSKWKTIARTRLNSRSAFKKALRLAKKGLHKFRVIFKHAQHLDSSSKVVSVRAI